MGIARQVSQHLLGTSERLFGVYHPLGFAQWRQVLGERGVVGEPSMIAEELQAAGFMGSHKLALTVVLYNRVHRIGWADVVARLRIPRRLIERQSVEPDDLFPRQAVGEASAHGPEYNP